MSPVTQDLLERVREAGLVGAASGDPLVDKLSRPAEVVIANGVSAEPLLRADAHLVTHFAGQVLTGLKLAMQLTRAKKGAIALKRSDREALAAAKRAIAEDGFAKFHVDLVELPSFYPAGEEGFLAAAIVGKTVPTGGSAQDAGVLVLNVMSLYQLVDLKRGKSPTRRLVTVTGAVRRPVTVWAPWGTPFETLVAHAGGASCGGPWTVLAGGPMRGRLDATGAVSATTGAIAVLPLDHRLVRRRLEPITVARRRAESTCHGCGRCTELCPAWQQGHPTDPHRVVRALGADPALVAGRWTNGCTGCNLCTLYACPVELDPATLIADLRQRTQPETAPARELVPRPISRIPLGRLARRLGLSGLDHVAPYDPADLIVPHLDLEVPPGAVPCVRIGDWVSYGQVVARPGTGAGGAPVRCGIEGTVVALAPRVRIASGATASV
jgi:Na+-translocating ferredoxin:NAD+ oxidoreductase RnfC subunit